MWRRQDATFPAESSFITELADEAIGEFYAVSVVAPA
jgi:hypothetical protein